MLSLRVLFVKSPNLSFPVKINNKHFSLTSFLRNEIKEDIAKTFFNQEVQTLLKTLTRVDFKRVFSKKKLNEPLLEKPIYKFMTEEELRASLQEAQQKADELLQMPPVLEPRKPINKVLSKDPALKGLETSKFVFTDITFGVPNEKRSIVVRQPDGTLHEAEWDVRDRMNQIYFPLEGRQLREPRMFDGDYFKDLLKRKEFIFILDRACVQYEPDDPKYQKVTQETYEAVNESGDFEVLRSTRHFGPFAFYLVREKKIDDLLLDLLEGGRIDEVNSLLKLYGLVNRVEIKVDDLGSVDGVREYIKKYSNKKGQLELALQAYVEIERRKRELEEGIKAAHGV